MRLSLKWLSEYVDLRLDADELAHRLTMAGLAVETIERTGGDWGDEIRVAEVVAVEPHPNADRLRLATVDILGERHRVVCGAPNVVVGQRVAFGTVGARIVDGHSGKRSVLKPAVIRGVESAGMVLSERELGLSDEHEGILELPADTPVGKRLGDVLGDTVFELAVTANRPDLLSVVGVAREVAALTGATVREPSLEFTEAGGAIKGRAQVDIEAPDLCARYLATVVEGVRIGPSPAWMQEHIVAAGQRPINNVVDVTNYVMLELGQPLHAFDYDRVAGHHIIVRRAGPGERFTTLDGIDRTLSDSMLAIADERGAVALAGVIGGLESEVTEGTTNILLEAASFTATNIRRTSTVLKVRSEASSRFEKGLPPELAAVASKRATKLLVEVCGGRALAGAVDAYPGKQRESRIEVRKSRVAQVLGIDPPTARARAVLGSLGFSARWVPPDRYVVRVPYWRTDVRIADDVVEEIARTIGYDEIPAAALTGQVPAPVVQPLRELREHARDLLAAAGMREVITYSLTTLEALARVVPPEELAIYPPYRAHNPISAAHEYMRTTLRASLLQTLASNLRYQEGEVAIFEAARVYLRPADRAAHSSGRGDGTVRGAAALPQEEERIAGVVSGWRLDRWGRPGSEPLDFFDAKAYVEQLFEGLAVRPEYAATVEFALTPGRTAEIRAGGQRVGVVGQVHPDVARAFELDQDAYLFDISIDALLPLAGRPRRMAPLPRYPSVEQDIAVIVDSGTAASAVQDAIAASSPLVRAARVFDVYQGEQVSAGKKSVAFAVTYQAGDHTLTDEEVAKAQHKAVERLRREFGAELRA
jgi:phenylalanyl-tRNA synthetase beta chain